MKFSLVIPCYNEAANLPLLLERCQKLLSKADVEVILVDNGSTDETPQVLAKLLPAYVGCRSVRVDVNKGYGYGIVSGLRAAKAEILGWTHADMQTDPHDALDALDLFCQFGPELFVKGKRYGRPLADQLFTLGMSIFETLLLRKTFSDINAQPTMFSRSFFESWGSVPDDFSLDLYIYYLAKTQGLKVVRLPVAFGKRAHGVSNWNVNWNAKWKFIRRTIDFSLQLKKNMMK
jgi:glycosyltransferase involved in cell wall biosynthesis